MTIDFPALNATLNGLSGVLLVAGYLAIRAGRRQTHIACMLAAFAVSVVFLGCYLYYHLVIQQGRPTRFEERAPGAADWVRWVYLAILLSHTVLAVTVPFLALTSIYLGWRDRLARHRAVSRWTMPIWLYVSVTGVVVYWMLYRLYQRGIL